MDDLTDSKSLGEIGRMLEVDALLFGSVEVCAGNFFTVGWAKPVGFSARLVDVKTASVLWSISDRWSNYYGLSMTNGLSAEMARRLVRRLGRELAAAERARR